MTSSATQFDKLSAAADARRLRVGLHSNGKRIVRVDLRDRERNVVASMTVTDIIDLQTASTELLTVLVQVDRQDGQA